MDGWALFTVLSLLAAFTGLSWWVRRHVSGPQNAPGLITVLARRPLDHGQAVWLLEVAGQRLLVGSGGDGVRLLARLDQAEGDPP